ncbi:BLUF domain-containing protein [Stappia sp. ES.058]|uniref:BLUF domain-containing protein n=1 Tax=Stappia sp. ES.058 TaxID=1881061 RepID=UPI00087B6F4E|nr:BLUF domain-containing protein [Stappia sp. ES.058]SDU04977.1 Sensors of blue-light using FAD [Stappia sp. ES.058]
MTLEALCYTCEIDWTTIRNPVDTEIERGLARARRLNRLNGVTGAILLYPDRLVQWLEGTASGLADSLDCASRDARLRGPIETLCKGEIETRLFGQCWLYFADYRQDADRPDGLLGDLGHKASTVSCQELRRELRSVAAHLEPARYTHAAMLV